MTKQEIENNKGEANGILTAKEFEALNEMKNGTTADEAGENMNISGRTVEGHITKVIYKFHARNFAHAVSIAYETGILQVKNDE